LRVNDVDAETELSRRGPPRWLGLRLAASILLLLPAIWFSWQTKQGLDQRREFRTDLAELEHVRYGILSADQWRAIIGPILNAQIDKIDLAGQTRNLRPMVERALNSLLDNMKQQASAPKPADSKGTAKSAFGNPMIVNMIINALRPHVPEYTDVVLAELAKPQNQKAFKDSVRTVMTGALKNTFSSTDMTSYSAILGRFGCSSGEGCEDMLRNRIRASDAQLNRDYLIVLASAALGFILLAAGQPVLSRSAVVVLMLFCIVMLVGGVSSPMIEVEVRISQLDATLLGSPIEFHEQSLYYRSKTVLEVFQTLIQMHRPAMSLVAVLVLLFSVVFPALKMLALTAALFRPTLLRSSRIVRVLALQLSKWSMADVMALAIFMSFVAFNAVVESGLAGLRAEPAVQQLTIPTNSSQILPGYYLFVGFCVAGIYLSTKLERGMALSAAHESI
jgi:hypothetical protein